MKTRSNIVCLRSLLAIAGLGIAVVAQAQPAVTSMYPDGTVQFQPTNLLAFSVSSGFGITSLTVQLSATNLTGSGTTQLLTNGSGLTVSGPATAETATATLTSNMVYTAVIQASDAGGPTTTTIVFDTINPSFTWEAEDYDYGGGLFFDNPQTNAYAGLDATLGVDGFNPNNPSGGGAGLTYRPTPATGASGNLGVETVNDTPRAAYAGTGQTDLDQGWNNGGSGLWGNYTRHFPAGRWNIYMRAAGWAASTESAVMYQGGTNGTLLGRLNVPNTSAGPHGTYQNYTWVPLGDIAGNPIEWDTDGTQQTLTIQAIQGNYNANFYMLMPIDPNFHPRPFVSNVYPDGSQVMFPVTNTFSFIANSTAGLATSNIIVNLNGAVPSGLTFSGSPHFYTVTFPIGSNSIYSVNITLTDNNGSSSFSTSFGTFSASNFTWEAEDWDYTNALYLDNPQVSAYAGLYGTPGVDANNASGGGTSYRGNDLGDLGNEGCGDVLRAQFVSGHTNDYDVGWTGNGNWANYTRHYPAGQYYVYMRGASPSGQNNAASLAVVTSGVGTPSQTLSSPLGHWDVPLTGGWQNWTWTPMRDTNGDFAVITTTGSATTLRMTENNGGFNANFFMLVPSGTVPFPPTITQLYPDGTLLFQRTNTLSFVVNSQVALTPANVIVTLNGVVLNNLVFGGTPTQLSVSWPHLLPNTAYLATIAVSAPNNVTAPPLTFSFDTFSPNYYTWEAEDWDYNSGQFFDNPQTNAYAGLAGTLGIDAINNSGGNTAYRANDLGDLGNEITGDAKRVQYTSGGLDDYDIGWTATGQWANYTRTYPYGVYNVYLRAASPGGQVDAVSLWQVTSGVGTSNQTLVQLGKFDVPNTGGWQNYTFVPMRDAGGNLVTITNSGGTNTFRMNEDHGGFNANFFMLIPAGLNLNVAHSGGNVIISFPTQTNATYQVQYKVHLDDSSWTPLGSPVNGTGGFVSVQDAITGSTRFYRAVGMGVQ